MTTLRETIIEHVAEALRQGLTTATQGQGPVDVTCIGLGYTVHVVVAPIAPEVAELLDAPCSGAGWLAHTSEAPAID